MTVAKKKARDGRIKFSELDAQMEAVRRSSRLTAADYAVRINARQEDVEVQPRRKRKVRR